MTPVNFKKNLIALFIPLTFFSLNAQSHENDNPLLTQVMFDQLELRINDDNNNANNDGNNTAVVDGQIWIGKDLNKFWLKMDAERSDGSLQEASLQALYSRAISPFWDAQIGLRHDQKPTPTRDWFVLGFNGLAPYWFDIDSALFIGESGRVALHLAVEYELLLTQRLILTPNIEVNINGQNDAELATGSGLSDITTGLRLRYEILREFAPYVGVNWNKKFGKTADYQKALGEDGSDTELVLGVRVWF